MATSAWPEPSADPSAPVLPLTGERTVPDIDHENYWFARHVAAYEFVAQRCRGLRVLDAGCGEGYGTSLLSGQAACVVGVDLVPEVVVHARARYRDAVTSDRVRFLRADLGDLPLEDASVDAVASLQVIEHLPDIRRYLGEIARVLTPGGRFFCATPNRLTFTPDSVTPVNPFHVREFAPDELVEALGSRFRVEAVYGVHHGPRLRVIEIFARSGFADLVLDHPPERRPAWLRAAVRAVRPSDFLLRTSQTARSLDLLAVAANPPPN